MEDTLTCPICNKGGYKLLTRHIERHHGMTKSEFHEQYPDHPLMTEKSRELRSSATKNYFENMTEEQRINHSNHSKLRGKEMNERRRTSGYNDSEELKSTMRETQRLMIEKSKTDSDLYDKLYGKRSNSRPNTSKTLKKKWKDPEFVKSVMDGRRGRGQVKDYSNGRFRSSWENEMSLVLDDLMLSWEYEPSHIEYSHKGKVRRYTPDFYVEELDLYIEVKPNKLINSLVVSKAQAVIDRGHEFFLFTDTHLNDPELFPSFINLLRKVQRLSKG